MMKALVELPRRWFNAGGFVLCAGLLGFAYFLQFHEDLDPCPLCIFQRLAFISLGLVFLLAALHHPQRIGSRIYGVFIALSGLIGAVIAGRHLWLQHLPPDQIPECGPGLDYMLEVFPLTETLRMAFTGSGECADIVWSFLGLSMPGWTLFWYLVLGITGLLVNWRAGN
jgi:disulfide bond formation protein DsbB